MGSRLDEGAELPVLYADVAKGRVFFKSGYPIGVFLGGAKIFPKNLRGAKISAKI
jgi:hypothetical protein